LESIKVLMKRTDKIKVGKNFFSHKL
jgi:hypothetical protein